jgi:hypothetical protein
MQGGGGVVPELSRIRPDADIIAVSSDKLTIRDTDYLGGTHAALK